MCVTKNNYSLAVWGLKDGHLLYWRGGLPEIVTEDVLEADFTTMMLLTKEDGCYGVVNAYNSRRDIRYLGHETMEYYVEFYKTLWNISK